MADLRWGKAAQTRRRNRVTVDGMSELPPSCRRSELRALPRPRCEHCGRKMRLIPGNASDLSDDHADPLVTIRPECPTFGCRNNGPGL